MAKRNFKYLGLLILFLCFFSVNGFSGEIKEYTLENGLSVFLMEDNSSPLVRIEYSCRAGFSSQTETTAGFFKLYNRIFAASLPQIEFSDVECGSDYSHFVILTPAIHTENYLELLAEQAFSPVFSDEIIRDQLETLRKEVKSAEKDAAFQINGAIDSRVFSGAPWKHDSGVYPAILEKVSENSVRTLLKKISDRWYTPQNSAVFISGNIKEEEVLEAINQSFGRYYSNYRIPDENPGLPINKQRKFVFHSPEFSSDIVQIVMQYTMLNYEQCEIAAQMLNDDYSSFKYNILQNGELGIPGSEYINAAAAHKRDSSRLIIQSIFQKSKKITSVQQAELFANVTVSGIGESYQQEFFNAQQNFINEFNQLETNSSAFMEKLSNFWAFEPFGNYTEASLNFTGDSLSSKAMYALLDQIKAMNFDELNTALNSEVPFVFVLVNSADYKKNKAAFAKAGYEEINSDNAFWFNQKVFQKTKASSENQIEKINENQLEFYNDKGWSWTGNYSSKADNDYYSKNKAAIKKQDLDNNIKLYSKFNGNSNKITIMISINGGKLYSADEEGLEEVMLSLLSQNIQREIYRQQNKGMIIGYPFTGYECQLCSGYVWIECDKNDFSACCKAISNALIYAELMPSAADMEVSAVQYNKRIAAGGTVNQLYNSAINQLYKDCDLAKLYNSEETILESITYQKILSIYPQLLDASRYSVILTGNFDGNYYEIINKTIGLLTSQNEKVVFKDVEADFSNKKELKVKLVHKFYGAPNQDRNAPMPSILIPTKDFKDPGIFMLAAPAKGTRERVCFEAVLLYLQRLNNSNFFIILPDSQVECAAFVFQNVNNKVEMEIEYHQLIDKLTQLFSLDLQEQTTQKIKDHWVSSKMSEAVTTTGTAKLMQKGLEYFPYHQDIDFYLSEYNFIQQAIPEDFTAVLGYLSLDLALKVYSQDTK